MTAKRIFAIIFIFGATTFAWFVLGSALTIRSQSMSSAFSEAVDEGWGPALVQQHPETWYLTPGSTRPQMEQPPTSSSVAVDLQYEPKKRGLMWVRTYSVKFDAEYVVTNPSPVTQTLYVRFRLPAANVTYQNFSVRLGTGAPSARTPENGMLVEAIELPAGGTAPMRVTYEARGSGSWQYAFGANATRIANFALRMKTSFTEIDFPPGTSSPSKRERAGDGWDLAWEYMNVLSPRSIGMDMPSVQNAGPIAARITFFAPVGLLFFFAVVLILGSVYGCSLHPMNYFFLAAGFFAFQLLFAYLVDLVPLLPSFLIACAVSLLLVGTYIHAVSRGQLTRLVVVAQFTYMVLFSYSFFFEGLTGLTITIGAIATLAILMRVTARMDWAEHFRGNARHAVPAVPPAI